MGTIVFTGFPGFLGSELLPRLLRRAPGDEALCLVQSKFAELARERARGLDRVKLAEGDITAPLAIDPTDVTEIYHLAAIYDLKVPRELGLRINVDGTRNVLDFAERCPSLKRLHYISTCYVSGRYDGVFTEDDLEKGQRFNNFYEETKYLAEIDVRARMKQGLPATIYRPSVVVGDSASGATQKFDGPYFVIQWLMRQPRMAVLPVAGRPSRYHFN
ncbi:MAG: SDR family oxidoreductase, partial [Alphaproteobacteria bacterium]|nr:SDR family oxidoreductase [Alphaproteobacteria bacterium]